MGVASGLSIARERKEGGVISGIRQTPWGAVRISSLKHPDAQSASVQRMRVASTKADSAVTSTFVALMA